MNTTNAHCYAVILAGGSGVRLWPLSRESMPKQLIPVLAGKSLMEAAFDRLQGVIPPERRWVGSKGKNPWHRPLYRRAGRPGYPACHRPFLRPGAQGTS